MLLDPLTGRQLSPGLTELYDHLNGSVVISYYPMHYAHVCNYQFDLSEWASLVLPVDTGYGLILSSRGIFDLALRQKTLPLPAERSCLLYPEQLMEVLLPEGKSECWLILFKEDFLQSFAQKISECGFIPFQPSSRQINEFNGFALLPAVRQESLVLQLVLSVIDQLSIKLPVPNLDQVNAIIAFMEQHLNLRISLPQIARDAGLTYRQMVHAFQAIHNTTPGEYFARIRVRHAMELLVNTDALVNEVASKVGYEPAAFSRIFKKYNGISPIEFQKKRERRNGYQNSLSAKYEAK